MLQRIGVPFVWTLTDRTLGSFISAKAACLWDNSTSSLSCADFKCWTHFNNKTTQKLDQADLRLSDLQ